MIGALSPSPPTASTLPSLCEVNLKKLFSTFSIFHFCKGEVLFTLDCCTTAPSSVTGFGAGVGVGLGAGVGEAGLGAGVGVAAFGAGEAPLDAAGVLGGLSVVGLVG